MPMRGEGYCKAGVKNPNCQRSATEKHHGAPKVYIIFIFAFSTASRLRKGMGNLLPWNRNGKTKQKKREKVRTL